MKKKSLHLSMLTILSVTLYLVTDPGTSNFFSLSPIRLFNLLFNLLTEVCTSLYQFSYLIRGCLHCLIGSVLDCRSVPPEFESWHGHIWRVFHLWLCFINGTFGSRSTHSAYHVHKSGHKTSIINHHHHLKS